MRLYGYTDPLMCYTKEGSAPTHCLMGHADFATTIDYILIL